MGEKPDQIERHIKNERNALSEHISELEEKVKEAFDWRTQFEEHPGAMMGAAFVGGAIIAALLPSTSSITRRVSSHRYSDPWSPYTNREVAQSSVLGSTGSSRAFLKDRKTSETWENLKGALMGLAATRVGEFVEQVVPGFTEHYKKAASGRPAEPFSTATSGSQDKSWQKPNGGADYSSHS